MKFKYVKRIFYRKEIDSGKNCCILEKSNCPNYYGHYCYGSLCSEAIKADEELSQKVNNIIKARKNRKIQVVKDEVLDILATHFDCKKENITII